MPFSHLADFYLRHQHRLCFRYIYFLNAVNSIIVTIFASVFVIKDLIKEITRSLLSQPSHKLLTPRPKMLFKNLTISE